MTTTTPDTTPVQCNLFNPTRGRRVIYAGIDDSRSAIVVDPGEIKYSVTISKMLAEELRDRTTDNPNADLILSPPTRTADTDQSSHAAGQVPPTAGRTGREAGAVP